MKGSYTYIYFNAAPAHKLLGGGRFMSFGLEVGIFAAYAAGLFLIYILGKLLIVPLKWAGRLALNSLIGGVLILLVNAVGGYWGIFLPLNLLTAVIAGVLGIPGVLFLLLFFNL